MLIGAKAATNQEFTAVVKRKLFISVTLFILGVVTLVTTFVATKVWNVTIEDYMRGLYSGAGTGLVAAGIVLTIKNYMLLKNEEKLRKARIESTDERNIAIHNKAVQVALIILLVSMYLVLLIGGLWYPILTKVISLLVFVFFLAYVASYFIISKKM